MMNGTILELNDIVKTYKSRGTLFRPGGQAVVALNQVSLNIQQGEIFGLVGESGSGKTTAGRLIVGLETPDSGHVFFQGHDITGFKGVMARSFRQKVQMIFQDPYQSLNPQFSVFDTISEPLVIHNIGHGQGRKKAVWEAMRSVGLSPPDQYIYRYPHQLSGGQRQRVAIARAMVLNPDFVVADEPTSMLDASISAQVFNILLEMRDRFGVTLLFITHSLAAARYLCDRIAVIYRGSLMEIGPAEDVIKTPRHPYTQALIDALPEFCGTGEGIKRYGTLLKKTREAPVGTGCPFFARCAVSPDAKCGLDRPLLKTIGSPHHFVACYCNNSQKDLSSGEIR
jgi:peptide/nickel transport system ATP-binding protein